MSKSKMLICSAKKTNNFQNDIEIILIKKRLGEWDEKNCRALKVLYKLFGPKPNQKELKCLAQVISVHLQIRLDREAARRKKVLIKWYDENIDKIEDFLMNCVLLVDEKGNPIGNDPRSSKEQATVSYS